MIILHGDHLVQSRAKLGEILEAQKKAGKTISRVDGASLDLAQLELSLGSVGFFDQPVVVIENVFSLPKSKKKDALLAMLKANQDKGIVIWEKKAVNGNTIKTFKSAQVQDFKLSKVMFAWLDSLRGDKQDLPKRKDLLLQVLAQENEFLCLTMLVRQVRLLIQAKENKAVGPSFMVSKLKGQARTFSLPQLLAWHTKLVQIDLGIKTGTSGLDLTQQLALLTL